MASEMFFDVLEVSEDDRVQVYIADPVSGNRKWLCWFQLSASESATSNRGREVLYLTSAHGARRRQRYLVCPFDPGGLWRELTAEEASTWFERNGLAPSDAFRRAMFGLRKGELSERFLMQLRPEEKEAWSKAAAAADMSLAAWIRWIVNAAYGEATK